MAAPYVSGAAALAIATSGGTLTNAQVCCLVRLLVIGLLDWVALFRGSAAAAAAQPNACQLPVFYLAVSSTPSAQVAQYLAASSRPVAALRDRVASGGIVHLEQLINLALAAKARADAAKKAAAAKPA